MSSPPPSPLATPKAWDLVSEGYVAELFDQFSLFSRDALDLAGVGPNDDVLDVACGPGSLVLQAAARARSVRGVDFSERMLAELASRAEQRKLGNIELLKADAQRLPLPDGCVDAAFSMFGLIFFPDRGAGLRELFRTLRPGGRVVIGSWVPFDNMKPLKALFQALAELMPELPFGKGKAPLGTHEDMIEELRAAGFEDVRVEEVKHRTVAHSVDGYWRSVERSSAPLVLLKNQLGEERWSDVARALRNKLEENLGPGPIELDFIALLGFGRR